MTSREAHIEALRQIWGFASMLHEGIEKGELSDNLCEDVDLHRFSRSDAFKIQKKLFHEANLLFEKRQRLIDNAPEKLKRKIIADREKLLKWKASLIKL